MKLQSLAIIFIIIVMPITMVLSTFISNRIECAQLELEYDTKLLEATYDAIKAYQLNSINNNFSTVANEKVSSTEAAVETLLNSLVVSFGYSGYKSSVMEEYIPAVVFTTYDGYYIYSPYNNTLTNLSDEDFSSSYSEDEENTTGLKPYVTYSCEYTDNATNSDFVITYTLDNYITIQGILNGEYHYDYGYLYNVDDGDYSIKRSGSGTASSPYTYTYDGITFTSDDTEEMKEYVGNKEYSYIKINGTKYYLDPGYYSDYVDETISATINGERIDNIDKSAGIFYIDDSGEKNYYQASYDKDAETFIKYYYAITHNKSAYEYFENAYNFSKAVLENAVDDYTDKAGNAVNNDYSRVLANLTWSNANIWSDSEGEVTSLQEYAGAGSSRRNQNF